MNKEKVGKNIRSLRKAFGETQPDLLYAIGKGGSGTISQYETGKQLPERDVLLKIAKHYKVTVDELVYGDFSNLGFLSIPLNDKAKMIDLHKSMFPRICTDSALTDPLFKKGHEAQMRMIKDMELEREFSDADFDVSFESYYESFELNGTLESAANLLWFIFIIGASSTVSEQMLNGLDIMRNRNISSTRFFRDYYLTPSDDEYYEKEEAQRKKERNEYLKAVDDDIVNLLCKLKSSSQWSDLADYYSALKYLLCLVDNKLSDNTNKAIGREMMWTLLMFKNKYARTLLRICNYPNEKIKSG